DNDWSNPNNWEESGSTATDYPNDPSDTVRIDSGTVTLDDNIVLNSLEIVGASLDLSGYSLIADTLSLTNGAVLTGDLTADNVTIDNSSTLDDKISFSGGGILEIVSGAVSIAGTDIVCGNLDLGARDVNVTQSVGTGNVELNSDITAGAIYLIVNGTGPVNIDTNWLFSEVTLNTDITLINDLS
ncbi:hypothetical protein, partial [Treponema sp. R80B11-R83G3]